MSAEQEFFVQALSESALFASVDRARLERLVSSARVRQVRAGDAVAWENDPQGPIFLILSGRVAIERITQEGVRIHLATIEQGEMVGELSLLLNAPRNATIRAMDLCRLLVIEGKELITAIQSDSKFALAIIQALAKRLVSATEDKSRSQWKLSRRLAYTLVEEARRTGLKSDRGYVVQLPMSQAELANQLGCTREALNRAIRELKEQEILEWSPKSVRILSPSRLKSLAK